MNAAGRPVALRTALIWRDEVMSDIVADAPKKITIGHKGTPTFIVPDVGLPPGFAIVSPGNRGYVLTLAEGMSGTMCIDGKEEDVADYVRRENGGRAPGGFCATPISGRDWGVIDLDDSGDYKLYFQFVTVETPLQSNADLFTMVTLAAACAMLFIVGLVAAGLVIVALTSESMEEALPRLAILMFGAIAVAFLITHPGSHVRLVLLRATMFIGGVLGLIALAWLQMQLEWSVLEWVTRGALLIPAGAVLFGMSWSLAMSDPEQQASTGFSIILHGALLIGTLIIYDPSDDPNVWPGPRALTGKYLTEREELVVKLPELPSIGKVNKEDNAPKADTQKNLKTATKNDEGASGGKGELERARNKNAKDNEKPDPPKIAFFEDNNKKILDNILDKDLSKNIGAFGGIKSDLTKAGSLGFGGGQGTGVGDGTGTGTTRGSKGKGTGGGGNVEGDFVTNKGKVDTGKERPGGTCVGPNCKGAGPKEVSVNVGEMSGDPGGYTEDEINRVVKRSAGMFRACYQKELNRSPGIGGKIVVKFKIGADGGVITASPTGGTTLGNEAVKECVARNVNRLKFPPKGAIANVTYPFLFSPGG